MPKRTSIGVDLGSSAVRAAEVAIDGKRSELTRFAQVGLPPGAIVEGEVRDQEAVASALKKLWSEGGFRQRDVVIGVSSQRAMVRAIEVPAMVEKELRSALRYEIGDLLPIPVDQAVFDFAVLGPGRPKGDGGETTQVLVVAAQKDIVRDQISVVSRAGLRARAVDASPLALLRAVPPPHGGDDLDAVVSLGSHLVVVSVRQGSTPRFLRTATVAAEVEALSARAGGATQVLVSPGRDPVVEEVRSSIEYFLSHAQGAHLERVWLTGGGALAGNVGDRLAAALSIPVVPASVSTEVNRAALGFTEGQLEEASRRWTTAIGLALWGSDGGPAPSLLPPEIAERTRQRREMVVAAAALVVVAGSLVVLSHSRTATTDKADQQAQTYQVESAALQNEISKLGAYTSTEAEVVARGQLVTSALQGDINWVSLYKRVQAALPKGVEVSSITFSASASPSNASTTPSPSGTVQEPLYVGVVSMTAQTSRGLPSVAQFVRNMNAVPGLGAVWVSSSESPANASAPVAAAQVPAGAPASKGASTRQSPATTVASTAAPPPVAAPVTFVANAEVTDAALSNRAARLLGEDK